MRLVLPVTGEVRGAVRDAEGRKLDRVMLMLVGPSGRQHVLAADDESFAFPRVIPGDYRLLTYRHGQRLTGSAPEGEPVHVAPRAVTTSNPVVPTSNHRIFGHVRDPGGAPIAGAFVVLRGHSSDLAPPVQTDASGRFAFERFTKGKYTLHAYRLGTGEATTQAETDRETLLTIPAL